MISNIENLDRLYCSQGDTSGRRIPKKYFAKAKGNFLFDEDGKPYLDMQMQNSSANFGYQNKDYAESLSKQMETLPSLASEFMNEKRVLLSAKICQYMEEHYHEKGRIHFNVGGAQAVDDALKLAANYCGNKNVFCFEGGYHGRTMAASSVSSSYRYKKQFSSVIQTYRIPFPSCGNCAYKRQPENCELYCIEQFKRLFESEYYDVYDTNSGTCSYGSFLAEPFLGRGGYAAPSQRYFSCLKQVLDEHQILFIDDEVQMGFYRTGKLWAFENYGIVPDIIIFGKAISNGLWPLSGIWAREKLISPDIWSCGSSHSTFAGHPNGMALGLTTFEIIERPDFLPAVKHSAQKFHDILQLLKDEFSIIGRLDIMGHAAGMEIINPVTKLPDSKGAHKIAEEMLNISATISGNDYGLVLSTGGVFENCFMLSPCLFISDDDLTLFYHLMRFYLKRYPG